MNWNDVKRVYPLQWVLIEALAHIPQFAFAFFAKSLGERICKVEFITNPAI